MAILIIALLSIGALTCSFGFFIAFLGNAVRRNYKVAQQRLLTTVVLLVTSISFGIAVELMSREM